MHYDRTAESITSLYPRLSVFNVGFSGNWIPREEYHEFLGKNLPSLGYVRLWGDTLYNSQIGYCIILVGKGGIGKTTAVRKLLKNRDYKEMSVPDTVLFNYNEGMIIPAFRKTKEFPLKKAIMMKRAKKGVSVPSIQQTIKFLKNEAKIPFYEFHMTEDDTEDTARRLHHFIIGI